MVGNRKGRDWNRNDWWHSKKDDQPNDIKEEKKKIKEMEEQLMNEALGIKPLIKSLKSKDLN